MSKAFFIGNGESRKGFDLEQLRPHGKIYGCNALYRDFTPDVLVAVDHGICHEIYNSGYCQKNEAWFRDWTKVPAMHYDMMIYSSVDKITRDEIKEYLINILKTKERMLRNLYFMVLIYQVLQTLLKVVRQKVKQEK